MKKRATTGLLVILCFLITSISYSQSEQSEYLKFEYIKVKPENALQYMEYMRNTWLPVYQQQVKAGNIHSWRLYRVFTPGGADGKYNFITVTSASGLEDYEAMRPRETLAMNKNSKGAISKIMEEANGIRTIMYTELWKAMNSMLPEGEAPHQAKYMMVDYMMVAPGKEYDYQMLEDEIAKPLHQERSSQGTMAGWELFSIITPGGSNYGYNFATGNYFNELKDIEFGFTEDVIQSAMPGTDIPELFDTIFSTRTLVQSQVWELVESTE